MIIQPCRSDGRQMAGKGNKGVNSKEKLMVDVSKMYYSFGMSQKNIAAEKGLSRGYVCQLLEQARKAGIVEIIVHDPTSNGTDLEKQICEWFDISKAIIISPPAHADSELVRTTVFSEACKYFASIVESDMIVAYSWGSTIYQISKRLTRQTEIRNVTAIPLCGGTSNLQKRIYVSEISSNIAMAFNGTPLFIPLPAILQNSKIKQAVYSDSNMYKVLNMIRRADIALFTVGSLPEQNVLYRGGYIDHDTMQNLIRRGAVGDLCAHFINEQGEICDQELDDRTVSIELEHFAGIRNKVCVATGSTKIGSLIGALRKHYIDVLISDENTMRELINRV